METAKAPLPFDEEALANASDDTEFEFELGDSDEEESPKEPDLIIPNELPEEEEASAVEDEEEQEEETKAYSDLTEEEKQYYGKRAQKRIQKLVAERKEQEEKFRELQSTVKDLQQKQSTYETRARQSDEQLLDDYIERNKMQTEATLDKLRRAKEEGSVDAELEATAELSRINAEGMLLGQYKQQYESQKASQGMLQQVPQIDQQAVARERQKTYEWMRRNPWFKRGGDDRDREMTLAAEQIHHALISEGYRPVNDPDAYYKELDARLEAEFEGARDMDDDKEPQRKVTQKVGGGSTRTATAGRSVKTGKTRVSLTKAEIETARSLGVPLEEYAKQKAAIAARG